MSLSDRCAAVLRPDEPDMAETGKGGSIAGNAAPSVFLMVNSLEMGGSERQFVELARSLDPAVFRSHLGCLQPKGALFDALHNVRHFGLGGSLYGWQSMRTRYRLARHLQAREVAVAHAFDFYANLTLIPAARMAGVPVVIGSQRQLGDLLSLWQSRVQRFMFHWSDCVVCNSRAAADALLEQGMPSKKVAVIGNGLAAEAFADTVPAFPRRAGSFRVGMIARMSTPAKNHRTLIRAAARLSTQLRNLEIVLVGDGPLRLELEREVETLNISDRVSFVGERRDIPAILASLDVTVLPSSSESLSNAILESMAAGIPVIANRVGGNGELIAEDKGMLVPCEDPEALEGALWQMAANDPLRRALGRNARRFAQENFTVEQMRKKHEELYNELLARKRWQPRPSRFRVPRATPTLPLRVTIVAASLRYVGGQSAQADLLLKNWQHDPEVEAELVPIDPPFPRGLKWVERIPGLRTVLREPLYMFALWRGLKDADIAHIFSASYWSFVVAPVPAWLMARLRKKKVLIHYHSGEARDHLKRFRQARRVLRKIDKLVVPSGYLVEVFREFGLAAEVVPNLVDLSQFSFRARTPLHPHLVCTRGFHPYYRVDLVVQAFAEVQKVFPQARLDLVGNGPAEEEIRDLVQEKNLSGVRFAGVMSRAEIAQAYNEADIFINASSVDNAPVSILEAFASGTPVVSTAPEGIRYLVDNERTGLLSRPKMRLHCPRMCCACCTTKIWRRVLPPTPDESVPCTVGRRFENSGWESIAHSSRDRDEGPRTRQLPPKGRSVSGE